MAEPMEINEMVARVNRLLATNDFDGIARFLRRLHPADSAELLTAFDAELQGEMVERLNSEELAEVFEQMDEDDVAEMAQGMNTAELADVLDEMEPDAAADLLGEMEPHAVAELLAEMEESAGVESLLEYAEDTAGGIMNQAPPSLRRWMTVGEAVTFIRQNYESEDELFYLYVLDRYGRLIGVVNLRALVLAESEQSIEEIMSREVYSVRASTDQEEAAQVLARYDLLGLPVLDEDERLVGVITVDDLVDVLEEEATEDIYRLAQVSEEAEVFSPIPRAIRNRLPWLYINMGTALLSATVISNFEGIINRVAALAAFMGVVAAQGGNAGNQTMTIMVRSLALGEISERDAWRAVRHELLVGLIHGLLLGISVGLIAWLWKGNPVLGVIIAVSMLCNLLIAATVGVLVPSTLKRLGIDPALASGVFVTASTDVLGYAIFLGLATAFLAWLV